MVNLAEYDIGVPAEQLDGYCPGGYHPVRLNDTLDGGRYEIVHKLGFGSFATVWLARDHRAQRNVSIKVVMARKSDEASRELDILRTLKERGDPGHPGRKHVAHLIDSFHHEGPNGRHLCVVLGLLGPTVSSVREQYADYRIDGRLARSVSRQLLLAVDYLHLTGVAHGDIHLGNTLFRRTDLEGSPLDEVLDELGPPDIGKIERYNGGPLEPGLPEYLVEPAELGVDLDDDDELHEIELIDFGESFFITDPPKQLSTPVSLHPPELVFHHTLSSAVDIWNLGCTTYEVVTGRVPFEGWMDDRDLIPQFKKVLGGVPEPWIQDALTSGLLKEVPDDSRAVNFLPLEEQIRAAYYRADDEDPVLSEADLEVLGRYLRRLLVVEAKQRATVGELLDDPWVVEAGGTGDPDTAEDEEESADQETVPEEDKTESGVVDEGTTEIAQDSAGEQAVPEAEKEKGRVVKAAHGVDQDSTDRQTVAVQGK